MIEAVRSKFSEGYIIFIQLLLNQNSFNYSIQDFWNFRFSSLKLDSQKHKKDSKQKQLVHVVLVHLWKENKN